MASLSEGLSPPGISFSLKGGLSGAEVESRCRRRPLPGAVLRRAVCGGLGGRNTRQPSSRPRSSEPPPTAFSFLWEQHGFSDIKVEDTAKGHIVLLQEAETLIQIEEDSTHIICDNDETLRVRLRDLVLKFLQKF